MADYKITNYEDYGKLEQARLMLKQELDAFMPDYSKVQQIGMDFDSFYNTGVKDNWRTIAVKLGDNQDPVEHADKFSNTLEILSECKGVENFEQKVNGAGCQHRSTLGRDYRGRANTTETGIPCQMWSDTQPHEQAPAGSTISIPGFSGRDFVKIPGSRDFRDGISLKF